MSSEAINVTSGEYLDVRERPMNEPMEAETTATSAEFVGEADLHESQTRIVEDYTANDDLRIRDISLASENVLRSIWETPEEDDAWNDL